MDDMSNMDMGTMDMSYLSSTPVPSLTDSQTAALSAFAGVYGVIWLVIMAVSIMASWKLYAKAGQAGWKSIIPIYNAYVLLKIVGRPGWWLLLLLIPLVNIIISLIIAIDLGKSFGKSAAYSVIMLWLLSLIGYCLLAFGKDTYIGPGGKLSTPTGESGPIQPAVSTPEPALTEPAAQS